MNKVLLTFLTASSLSVFTGCGSDDKIEVKEVGQSVLQEDLKETVIDTKVNSIPVATFDTFSINKNSRYDGELTATDADGDILKYVIVLQPKHGAVVVHDNGCFTYTPDTGYRGSDTFSYKASDDLSSCHVKKVTVDVCDEPILTPTPPTNLQVTALSTSKLKLTWDDNSMNENGFVIYQEGIPVGTTSANKTKKILCCGLKEGTTYNFEVRAKNKAGTSAPASAQGTTLPVTTAPSAPTKLKAKCISKTSLRLSWKDNADNKSEYRVYKNGVHLKTISNKCRSTVVSKLDSCTPYNFRVEATNKIGSTSSDAISVETLCDVAEAKVTIAQALLGPLSGADFKITKLDDNTVVAEGTTTVGDGSIVATAGLIQITQTQKDDLEDGLYLVEVTSGLDIDVGDDGTWDGTPMVNNGTLHAVVTESELKAGDFKVNILTEIVYQDIKDEIASNALTDVQIEEEIRKRAGKLLDASAGGDIDGDGDIDGADLLAWNPVLDQPTLSVDYDTVINPIADQVIAGVDNEAGSIAIFESLNSAPTANAGVERNVITGNDVTLDGSTSFDIDGDLLTYQWSFLNKPGTSVGALLNPLTATPSFTADITGDYLLQLIVNDGTVDSVADEVTITAGPTPPSVFGFSGPQKISRNNLAFKTKLVRMKSGWLVSPYGDAAGPEVYDTKGDTKRLARDIFVRVCHPANNTHQCSMEGDWSEPINISNTANLTSIETDWNEDPAVPGATPFYGDSDKPNIFVNGSFAAITWVDKYCDGGEQRMINYTARDGLSVPFSCTYVAYTDNVAGGTWTKKQLTDGSRDAKSDTNKGLSIGTPAKGKWIITWQEDPHGLQLGGASGPGDGASGANVTHGTDIWYTYTEDLMTHVWSTPVRITDNYTNDGSGGNTSPIFHPSNPNVEITESQRGKTGASRANTMLVGGTPIPTAVIAYEESKGADRMDSGKYIRYHEFPFNAPPASTGQYANGEPGCIISDPLENSRRVRFVSQSTAPSSGLKMGVFWRQGHPTEGGPGDIMVRVGKSVAGSTGLRPEDMIPAVDANCRVIDYAVAKDIVNIPASNISSNTIPWSPISCAGPVVTVPDNNLTDTTSLNPYEDAKAHRAAIVGNDFYLGYSYAKDWAVATYTDMDNYNFWIRRYDGTSGTWSTAVNVSNITDVKIHAKEPRLVKTPGSGKGCADGTYLENCRNASTLIIGWGVESNVYSHVQSSVEGDIFYSRTRDKAVTFEPPVVVPGLDINNNRFESQLRPSPAGNIIWTVWNEADNVNGGSHSMLSVSDESVGTPPTP